MWKKTYIMRMLRCFKHPKVVKFSLNINDYGNIMLKHFWSEVSLLDWVMHYWYQTTHTLYIICSCWILLLKLSPWNRIRDDLQLGSNSQLADSCSDRSCMLVHFGFWNLCIFVNKVWCFYHFFFFLMMWFSRHDVWKQHKHGCKYVSTDAAMWWFSFSE